MTASVANGFAQIVFDPDAKTCTSRPYACHPMYATSNEHTRVPWAAHSFNVAFSDEIGHYNYCDKQDNSIISGFGACLNSPVEAETDPKTGQHNEADKDYELSAPRLCRTLALAHWAGPRGNQSLSSLRATELMQ
jgi:hypothetical protein